jgi:catechol 2,3-dioxygenase-like lactoylglutathione lyase family enzyme
MRTRVDVITLAVDDLDRSMRFYRDGLGLQTEGVIGTEYLDEASGAGGAVVMFGLQGELTLALYKRSDLAKDAGMAPAGAGATPTFSIGHIVDSKGEVDELLARAAAAGATLSGGPRERPWGIYSGYFRDPDGHFWEIIWNHGEDAAG